MLMVYVSRDMHERLHELRRATGRSMSEHVRRALDEYLAR
ncbi:CopG family transcriptional regulator [bacterium]|nr:MAG: CopG family transcriptional regulator [bacterium]